MKPAATASLDDWLVYIEHQHSQPIALGLDRVRAVKNTLGQSAACPVILVGGTNGKGSTCAMLEKILICAGYRVGLYTSPHLISYNERVRIDGIPVADAVLVAAFSRVEDARAGQPLTYFEFGTLAAWEVFAQSPLDAIILEVGLGGRLDAVNVYEPDCAIVTGIDLDHQDYLGSDRESIGREKAGIFRPGCPAICGDPDPPASLKTHADAIGARWRALGNDFGYERADHQWQFWRRAEGTDQRFKRSGLAYPGLRGRVQLNNAASVLEALECLRDRLPVAMQDIRRGLLEVELSGRFQVIPGRPAVVLDVAHNPQAARSLSDNLGSMAFHPETWAVFGMLQDKDVREVVRALKSRVTRWLPCTLSGPRGMSAQSLIDLLSTEGIEVMKGFDSPAEGLRYALEHAGEDDRIAAFGSFLTVADAMRELRRAL